MAKDRDEPRTAPQPDRWYNLTLGPSFKHDSSNKYCTLRYEFKPASIDKTKKGTLQKNKENRVSVEFQNNQLGKPKVAFEGSSEDYKENDAVLFFDGETFRLERLHRAVKQLRHVRLPGESAAAASSATSATIHSGPAVEPRLSPVAKVGKPVHSFRNPFPAVPVEVEQIDIGEPQNPGPKPVAKGAATHSPYPSSAPAASPGPRDYEAEENQDIDIDELFGSGSPDNENNAEQRVEFGSDANEPRHNDSDDEIADVDDSGDEGHKGQNAADALRAQLNAEGRDGQTSSSGSSSGSGSGSGSSSSSDSDASDDDSVNSV
ncbi:hypothetical protein BT93_G1644 [Corymbia citriodora subsp. variegata]|nr:hypothetical protein BT93_G1644 [Corymbia citriodora subsp. variegata]